MTQLRVLTVTDLRQDRRRYHALAGAVEEHRPDVVAVVGDFLEPRHREGQLSIIEAARLLAQLPVADVVFCRGDREGSNWFDFKFNWPHAMRPLIALYGRAHVVGPLALLGFPCHVGSESPWACTMPRIGNQVILNPFGSGRTPLPVSAQLWLPALLQELGPAGRVLWLMHEPPMSRPLATTSHWNREWHEAVWEYQPLFVVSGHGRVSPRRHGEWLETLGNSYCLNAGQCSAELAYALIEFTFKAQTPASLLDVVITANPWQGKGEVVNRRHNVCSHATA